MNDKIYKILFIEDDKFDQMALKRLVKLEKLPYEYTVVDSVEQARRILKSDIFDIIFTDYSLGDGTGFEILQEVQNVPVVFITGAGDEEIAVKAMKAGAYDYMVKDGGCDHLKLLPQIIIKAIRHKKTADALKSYYDKLETLVQKRTEQLNKEKELLAVTLSGMSEAVIAVDIDKNIFLFNRAAELLTEYQDSEADSRQLDNIIRLIDEKTNQLIDCPVERAVEEGKTIYGSAGVLITTLSGRRLPVVVTVSPVRNATGSIIGAVIVLRDVSHEREIDNLKTNLITGVSHELQAPLTAIKSYADNIIRDPSISEQNRNKFLNLIEQQATHLQKIIDEILELAALESGEKNLNFQLIELNFLLDDVLTILGPVADKKDIKIKREIPADFEHIYADRTKMQSLLANLISNAVKFTPEKGLITISAAKTDLDIAISISDTGIGIPRQALPKIFNRFCCVTESENSQPGTGLGLAIVKEIIDMHRGRIDVESILGKGSNFTVYLPVRPERVVK